MGNALHQAAVAEEHPGMVIHNRVPLTVELGCQVFSANAIPTALAKPSPEDRSRLDARGVPILGGPGVLLCSCEIA